VSDCNGQHVKNDGSWWENDARGIALARVCDGCIKEKLGRFNAAVLTDSQQEIVGVHSRERYEDVVEEPVEAEP
jgi:hypothetical protein